LLLVFSDEGYWQVVCTMYLVQFSVIIQGMATPFLYPGHRRIEFFNEACLLVWCHLMVCFSDFVPDPACRYIMGFALITLVAFSFLINLIYINWYAPRKLFHMVKNKILKWMGRKSQKEQKAEMRKKRVQIKAARKRKEEDKKEAERKLKEAKEAALKKP
jgi:hypothetical protein